MVHPLSDLINLFKILFNIEEEEEKGIMSPTFVNVS